jgi:hypothetical protein
MWKDAPTLLKSTFDLVLFSCASYGHCILLPLCRSTAWPGIKQLHMLLPKEAATDVYVPHSSCSRVSDIGRNGTQEASGTAPAGVV